MALPISTHTLRPRPRTCARCDTPITVSADSGLCLPCVKRQLGAYNRVKRLRTTIDRIRGALGAVKRITSLEHPVAQIDWRGSNWSAEFRDLEADMVSLEQEIDLLADEWTMLLLKTRHQTGMEPE